MLNSMFCFLIVAMFPTGTGPTRLIALSKLIRAISLEQISSDSLKAIDPALFRQDFMRFRGALEQKYPSLYRFKDKRTVNRLLDSCYASINRHTTQTSFFVLLKFILSSLEDGHFYCGTSPDFKQYYEQDAKVFPLQLRFIKDNAYVICSSKTILPAGTQVLALNHVAISQIKKNLFRYIVSDGAIQTKKYWTISSNFWFYYAIVYGQPSVFNVLYKTKGAKTHTIILKPDLKKNIDCSLNVVVPAKKLRLTYTANNVALLTISTFNSYELAKSKEDFNSFLQSAFKELKDKGTGKLIIDLRGNGGGIDDYGALLYSYLTAKNFQYYYSLETTSQKLTENTPYNLPAQNPDEDPFRGRANLQLQKPVENNFKGQVYFLIDGLSFSTTAEFCAIARSNHRGEFIGEETGGGYEGNTSGNSIDTLLVNSKNTISIPTTKYVLDVKKAKHNDRGIIPDYHIASNIDDILKDKDVQLNFALQLAAKKQ